MKNLTLIVLLIALSLTSVGQDKKTIKEKGITETKTYEQRMEKGLDDKFLTEVEKYDEKGRTIELKVTTQKGDVDSWEKYTYDEDGNVVEEIQLDKQGKTKKRIVTKYKNDIKISKEYFDSENRLVKRKTYEYKYD
ncbi:MAG: hypothetical protein K9H64_12350 [Bacteroidales bacterium]|nr:hypothetical protein [Bacteroidales bacterium]MCF8456835.1 hypothetical protein [Bacteroidales bacterium]